MGLDMYLKCKLWTGDYNVTITNPETSEKIATPKINIVEFEVAYWRKFNALHNWFVENVQEGVDDCKDYFVEKEQLVELLSILENVLKNPNDAELLLPSVEGFFFGSTDYDEYYFKKVQDAINQIKEVIDTDYGYGDLYYSSSW